MTKPQFLTNEAGERVGVLLDLASYEALKKKPEPHDQSLLSDLSQAELVALAASKLSLEGQAKLSSLIQREKEGLLSPEEIQELDNLLEQLDQLNLLKARALYTLKVKAQRAPGSPDREP